MTPEELEAEELKKAEEAKLAAEEKAKFDALSQEEKIAKQIADGIAAALKPIKQNLDNAYSERDKVKAELDRIAKEKRELELQRLKDEGKFKEAHEIEVKTLKEEKEATDKRNVELTRDVQLKDALSGLDFSNVRSMNMAASEITAQLVRNEDGKWVHKTGASIEEFVSLFATNDENEFLFKPKLNSGGGGKKPTNNGTPDNSGSLFKKSQTEVLKMAREGKLPRRQ